MPTTARPRAQIVDFDTVPGIPCPCGIARRAFNEVESSPVSIHLTEISEDARAHYHESHTETYYILSCGPDARMQLDDEIIPLKPGLGILIPPGVRHRAIGRMTILNIVSPRFDPADEHFDD